MSFSAEGERTGSVHIVVLDGGSLILVEDSLKNVAMMYKLNTKVRDDEQCWIEDGVSNIEGGCYAKCIDLSTVGVRMVFQTSKVDAMPSVLISQEKNLIYLKLSSLELVCCILLGKVCR